MEVYAFAENKKTGTIHILSKPGLLVYKHKTFDERNLSKFIPYHPDIPGVLENNNFWGNIKAAKLMAAYLTNIGKNVCGNCVRELYKNNYPDMD